MSEEKKNHWSFLSNLLGVQSSSSDDETEAESPPVEEPSVKAEPRPPQPEKKERKPPAPKPAGWGSLANEFGLEFDEPEPVAAEEEAQEAPMVASDFKPETQETAARDEAPKLGDLFEAEELPPTLPGFGVIASPAREEESSTWDTGLDDSDDFDDSDDSDEPELEEVQTESPVVRSRPASRDDDDDTVVESGTGDDEDTERKPRRRRRRRKRRSDGGADESVDREAKVVSVDKVVSDDKEIQDSDDLGDSRDEDDEDSDRERRPRRRRRRRSAAQEERTSPRSDDAVVKPSADSALDDEGDEERPRRRSRKRHRGQTADTATSSELEPVGDIDNREEDEGDRTRARQFASWTEAIGHVVEANLAKRTKSNGRGGGGRGRGGRGRSRDQGNKSGRGRRSGGDSR